jgi:hypothetical protein
MQKKGRLGFSNYFINGGGDDAFKLHLVGRREFATEPSLIKLMAIPFF